MRARVVMMLQVCSTIRTILSGFGEARFSNCFEVAIACATFSADVG